jgi:hypothetical protein
MMRDHKTLLRRYFECTAFVLLWMAAEHYFRLKPLTSQLLGIPLIAAFQLLVARRPLQQLWAFDATTFQLDRRTLAIAGGLVLACGALLWGGSGHAAAGLNERAKFFLLILASAIPAAFALRHQAAAALRRALPLLLAALVFRVGWHAFWQLPDGPILFPAAKLLDFFTTWMGEFVALFLVDEVAFRGALDPHLVSAGTGRLHQACSAIFVSMLWGVWHLPAYNPNAPTFLALFGRIGPFTIGVTVLGTLLAFAARRSRTLAPTSAMHAFGNAYVLALMK